MDAPQNNIWGPALWAILHTAAERIGSRNLARLPQEETRIWSGLLSSLRYSLPCPLCKKHYTEYSSLFPLTQITRENVREWLYTLHCRVNLQTNKMTDLTLDQMQERYFVHLPFSTHYQVVEQQMKKSQRLGWCSRDDLMRTIRFLVELQRFYGL